MDNKTDLRGVISFLPTPSTSEGVLDYDRLSGLVEAAVRTRAKAVTLFGSVGAVGSFPIAERMRAAEIAVKQAAGRIHVMVGTGAVCGRETLALSRHAESVGADSILLVPITYWILNEAEVLEHYRRLDASVGIPIAVYNNPRLTGVDMQPELIARLAELKNVRYLKEACPDVLRISKTKELCGDRIQVLAGRENITYESLLLGADGWTSVLFSFVPEDVQAAFAAGAAKDFSRLRALTRRLHPLGDFVMSRGVIRVVHAMYDLIGESVGQPPLPVLPLTDAEELARLATIMRNLGISVKKSEV